MVRISGNLIYYEKSYVARQYIDGVVDIVLRE